MVSVYLINDFLTIRVKRSRQEWQGQFTAASGGQVHETYGSTLTTVSLH